MPINSCATTASRIAALFCIAATISTFNCAVDHTNDFSDSLAPEDSVSTRSKDTAASTPHDSIPVFRQDSVPVILRDSIPITTVDSIRVIIADSVHLNPEKKTLRHDYHVYYGNLHNHCDISGAFGTPEQAYQYARDNARLDFFGIADHDGSFAPGIWASLKQTANSFNANGTFAAFWGFEWTESNVYGHITVVNSDDYCQVTDSATNSFGKLCAWLNVRDCVAFFNHPGAYNSLNMEFDHFNAPAIGNMVGMELWNKTMPFTVYYYNEGYDSNDNHEGFFDEALSRGWKIGATGGMDNHVGTWGTENDYRMAILADSLTRDHLLVAMKARRFYSTLDKNISLSFTLNDREMGSTIKSGGSVLRIHAVDGNKERFSEVILFDGNHRQARIWQVAADTVVILDNLTTRSGDYYYIKIRQLDGDEAVSSPIWISDSIE